MSEKLADNGKENAAFSADKPILHLFMQKKNYHTQNKNSKNNQGQLYSVIYSLSTASSIVLIPTFTQDYHDLSLNLRVHQIMGICGKRQWLDLSVRGLEL